jgi:16S rRNA (guanine966-N2)-methyltransferase
MLRIIGGTARGVPIKAPDTKNTRPTLDRIKESVFNILMPYIADTVVLDLFAGSGSLGIEALSRGAKSAVFVDKSKKCRDLIFDNLDKTKFTKQATVLAMDAAKAINYLYRRQEKFDIIFLDPPYKMNFIVRTIQNIDDFDIMSEESILACEHHMDETPPEKVGKLVRTRVKHYGETLFSFYVKETRS